MLNLKSLLLSDIDTLDFTNWHKVKRQWAKTLGKFPKNSEILSLYQELLEAKKINPNPVLEKSLKIRSVRTLSGVAPFAVMMKPYPCPGNCIYCVQEKGMPKSYMSDEPAAARAKQMNFDPQTQILSRLEQMEKTGHHPEKLEIIVIGGTFSAYSDDYKKSFLKAIYDTCNNAENLFRHPEDSVNRRKPKDLVLTTPNSNIPATIQESQLLNQSAKYKIIGMSVETRPDWITPNEIKLLRQYGVTRVQLGVQALDEKILAAINRGHSLDAIAQATKLLRNAGFKINYHFMPNLPTSNPKKDIAMAKLMFSDSRFKPDTLKIYPCIVLPHTLLEKLYQEGKFQNYSDKILSDTLVKIKQLVPIYCRIDRLVRDITSNWTVSGTRKTNMRQLIQQKMKAQNLTCQCIRCREVKNQVENSRNLDFKIKKYKANDGLEYFLTYEENNKLYAILRLRFPYPPTSSLSNEEINSSETQYLDSSPCVQGEQTSDSDALGLVPIFPILQNSALIRELHVFGLQATISKHSKNLTINNQQLTIKQAQHQSLGKKLIAEAEKLAKENGYQKIAIISGVGVRDYYAKLGYHLKDSYMIKKLD